MVLFIQSRGSVSLIDIYKDKSLVNPNLGLDRSRGQNSYKPDRHAPGMIAVLIAEYARQY